MKLIAIGDNVTDCYIKQRIYYPGGNALNVAVNCKKNGVESVNYIGIFGNDDRADYIKQCLEEEGVTYCRSRKVYAPTGQPGVILENGDRKFVPGKRDTCQHLFSIKLVKEDLEFIKNYDLCITSCYSNLEYELETLSEVCRIAFDFSEKLSEAYLKRTCPYLTYAFFSGESRSEDECKALLLQMHALGTRIVGATRGMLGQLFYDGEIFYHGKAKEIEAIDTMGAGDSFIAGFLTAHAHYGLSIPEALSYAAERAAQTCLVNGSFGHGHPMD